MYIDTPRYHAILCNSKNTIWYTKLDSKEELKAELFRLFQFFKGRAPQIAKDIAEILTFVSLVSIDARRPVRELKFEEIVRNA